MKGLLSAPLSSRKIVEYLLLFLLLASVIGVAAYGGYWYGKGQQDPKEPTPQQADYETAEWKTYRSVAYSFEFSHPAGWKYRSDQGELVSGAEADANVIRYMIKPFSTENEMVVLIKVWDNPEKLSTIAWLSSHEEWSSQQSGQGEGVGGTVFEVNSFVDGLPAYKDTRQVDEASKRTTSGGTAFPLVDYYVARGDFVYAIELNNYTTFNEKGEYALFDQLVSTFHFIKPGEAGGTAGGKISVTIPPDWETYDKDFLANHFRFRYPSDYEVLDNDSSSGDIYLMQKGVDYPILGGINTFTNSFGGYFPEYKSGSREEWFKESWGKIDPGFDTSGISFEEFLFTNGKSYLKVTNASEGFGGFYLGVQDGIPFFASFDEKLVPSEDLLRILSTLEVSS